MKDTEAFMSVFINEYVEIIMDFQVVNSVNVDGEGNVHGSIPTPMVVGGIVMDCDGYFLYLSSNQEDVDQAIPLSGIKHIQVVNQMNELDQLIDDIEPTGGYN